MDDYVQSEIVVTLGALGYSEDDEYFKGPDCLESLKDLIRFLRRDEATCSIRRQLGHAQVVQNDLIPILRSCSSQETEIFEVVIRLLVNLTQPAILCFDNKPPESKAESVQYMEITSHLQAYKEAFTQTEVMACLGTKLGSLLQLDWNDRQDEDTLLIERMLLLIRNILHVPADPQAEKRTEDDASVHDQVLWSLHVNGLDDLLLYIGSCPDERRWSMHTLEIISLMFREQNAATLSAAGQGRSVQEKSEDERQLDIIRQRELAEKRKTQFKYGARHSRFGGTFCVQNIKSISEKPILYHKPLPGLKNMTFDTGKQGPRKRKADVYARESVEERKSTLSIRLFLKDFCSNFLEHCYNPLLNIVRENLVRDRSQENDESYYLWAMRFFMEFNRHMTYKTCIRVDLVSDTLSVTSFSYVCRMILDFCDRFTGEKKNLVTSKLWSRRMHLGVKALRELLMYVLYMSVCSDKNLCENANIIKANIFYEEQYREIFLLLIKSFQPSKHTKSFLSDVVDTFHVFLKMLEKFSTGKGHLLVQKKKKVQKRRKKSKQKSSEAPAPVLTPEEVEEQWQMLTADLSALLQGHDGDIAESASPFDAASDETMDEQRVMALSNIKSKLRAGDLSQGVALLRAARDIWPADSFGNQDIGGEEEFMCLYEIFRMDLPVTATPVDTVNDEVDEEDEIAADEEEIAAVQTRETEFDFNNFIKRLVSPKLIEHYCWLLKFYKTNTAETNHAVVKMLHRIAIDLKTPAMLFQVSVFMSFKDILFEPVVSTYKEIAGFAKYITAKFFSIARNNPMVFTEALFWKTNNVAYEITEGYGSLEMSKMEMKSRKKGQSWTAEEEDELRQLYDKHRESEDVVDDILNDISNEYRSRQQVLKKLTHLGLIENPRELRKRAMQKKRAWTDDENDQLRELFEEHKDAIDPLQNILLGLLETGSTKSKRQVSNQLMKTGIAQDRKQLRKKRVKKPKQSKSKDGDEDGFLVEDDNRDDSENELSDMSSDDNDDGDDDDDDDDDDDNDDDLKAGASLPAMLYQLKNTGLSDQITWIQTRLRRTANDRETEENWQPVPLVTLTEESEEALGKKLFQRVLRHVGLVPPASEQESFWRIPAKISPEELRKSADEMDNIPEEPPNNQSGNDAMTSGSSPSQSKANDPRRRKLAALAQAMKKSSDSNSARKRRDRHSTSADKNSKKQTKRTARSWRKEQADVSKDSGDDDDSDADVQERVEEKQETPKQKPKKRIKRFEESDSETENLRINEEEEDEEPGEIPSFNEQDSEQQSENAHEQESEEQTTNLKKRARVVEEDSDSDDDDFNMPLKFHKKTKCAAILDDDEESD